MISTAPFFTAIFAIFLLAGAVTSAQLVGASRTDSKDGQGSFGRAVNQVARTNGGSWVAAPTW